MFSNGRCLHIYIRLLQRKNYIVALICKWTLEGCLVGQPCVFQTFPEWQWWLRPLRMRGRLPRVLAVTQARLYPLGISLHHFARAAVSKAVRGRSAHLLSVTMYPWSLEHWSRHWGPLALPAPQATSGASVVFRSSWTVSGAMDGLRSIQRLRSISRGGWLQVSCSCSYEGMLPIRSHSPNKNITRITYIWHGNRKSNKDLSVLN